MAAGRAEVADHGRAGADRDQLVELELDARLAGDRQQVQESVGRAAGRGDPRHRVLERAAVEEAAGGRAAAGERDGQRAVLGRVPRARLEVVGGAHAVPERRDPEELDREPHRVGRELTRARARPGTGDALELVEPVAVEQAAPERADRLPDLEDRRVVAAPGAGAHRAAVDHERGLVHARERHQRGRHGLVAADDADQRVEVVRDVHQLDRVGDQLARDERRAHSRRPLRLVVGDGDRVELERHAARLLDAAGHGRGQLAVREVARHRARPGRRDTDDRAGQPPGIDAHGAEVRARARPRRIGRERLAGVAAGLLHPPQSIRAAPSRAASRPSPARARGRCGGRRRTRGRRRRGRRPRAARARGGRSRRP